ncbi:MAG: biotin transporter BioY [Selenomonadaceae bacterium]|nr:biotin transporter BioY [Selenomonadaceae bacterium]MBR0103660.1 biotin transporter BioY [Selenomonadaceae bacterium]
MQVRDLTKMAMCVALCCVTAHISFPLPFTPGYVTALTFAMSLSAYLLPPRQTFTVILIYILMGAVGLPVFATGEGLSRLVGPVGGFYFAWLVAYPLLSLAKGEPPSFRRYAVANVLIAVPITYVGGVLSMMLVLDVGLLQAMTMAVLPFIPGDLMKATAAALLGVKVQKILEER